MPVPVLLLSPIDQMVQTLQKSGVSLPENYGIYLTRAREDLRWLETKRPLNSTPQDRVEARASIVLVFVFGRMCQTRLPTDKVAKLAGLVPRQWQQLYTQLEHYLIERYDGSKAGSAAIRISPRRSTATLSVVSHSASKRQSPRKSNSSDVAGTVNETTPDEKATPSKPSKLITDLSIRLASRLAHNNVHELSQKASKLWSDYQAHVRSILNAHERQGELHDLQRFSHAYQVACWFIAATSAKTQTGSNKPTKSSLTLRDVIQASPGHDQLRSSDLRSIVRRVEFWQASLSTLQGDQSTAKRKAVTAAATAADSERVSKKGRKIDKATTAEVNDSNATSKIEAHNPHSILTRLVNSQETTTGNDMHHSNVSDNTETDNGRNNSTKQAREKFAAWRKSTLEWAKQQVDTRSNELQLSSSQLLEEAANRVLQKYNIPTHAQSAITTS
jgi:hypothetical protein